MNKTVLFWFAAVAAVLLVGVPVAGTVIKNGGTTSAYASWAQDNLPGTKWTYTHHIPLEQGDYEVGSIDLNIKLHFKEGNKLQFTSNVLHFGEITPFGTSLLNNLSTDEESTWTFEGGQFVNTNIGNPLHELNALGGTLYTDKVQLMLENGSLKLVGGNTNQITDFFPMLRSN